MKSQLSVNRGFTLLELLVAMAVMAMVLTLLFSVSGGTLATTRLFNRNLDAAAQGRAVLDALESDLANAVTSRGLSIYGNQGTGTGANAELAFITQGRGPTISSRFMGVCYQLSPDGSMHRFSNPASWDHADLSAGAPEALSAGSFSALGKGILRFSVCAVLDNGKVAAFTDSASGNTWKFVINNGANSAFFGLNLANPGAPRVRALVVGVVAVDEQTFQMLQKSGQLDQAIAAFPAPAMSGTSVINTPDDWAASLSSRTNTNLNALPPSILGTMQVLHNTFFFH